MQRLDYATPFTRTTRRIHPVILHTTSILLFAGALTMFVLALRLPAWHFTTPKFPNGGEDHHAWTGWKCLKYGFMFYPSNLLLLGESVYGLIVTVLDWRRPAEKAFGMSPDLLPVPLASTVFVVVCGYFVGPLETAGCGLWMGSHVAYTVGVAIRAYEILPYRRLRKIHAEQLDAVAVSRDQVAGPWRSIQSLREGACPSGAALNGGGNDVSYLQAVVRDGRKRVDFVPR